MEESSSGAGGRRMTEPSVRPHVPWNIGGTVRVKRPPTLAPTDSPTYTLPNSRSLREELPEEAVLGAPGPTSVSGHIHLQNSLSFESPPTAPCTKQLEPRRIRHQRKTSPDQTQQTNLARLRSAHREPSTEPGKCFSVDCFPASTTAGPREDYNDHDDILFLF